MITHSRTEYRKGHFVSYEIGDKRYNGTMKNHFDVQQIITLKLQLIFRLPIYMRHLLYTFNFICRNPLIYLTDYLTM